MKKFCAFEEAILVQLLRDIIREKIVHFLVLKEHKILINLFRERILYVRSPLSKASALRLYNVKLEKSEPFWCNNSWRLDSGPFRMESNTVGSIKASRGSSSFFRRIKLFYVDEPNCITFLHHIQETVYRLPLIITQHLHRVKIAIT